VSKRTSKATQVDIVAEASAWFIEFRAGPVASSDRARFDEWLCQSPQHIQAYLEISAGWAELPTNDPQGHIDIAALLERARHSGDGNVVSLPQRPSTHPPRARAAPRLLSAALAAAALLVGVAFWVFSYEANTYRTGVGEQRTVRLLDGSTIELNALSSVRVRLSSTLREIDLKRGQALFHVAKDPARPFIVRSDVTSVRAVGTEFDVYRKATATVVTVVEGRVAVDEVGFTAPTPQPASQPEPMLLDAGEQVTLPTGQLTADAVKRPPRARRTDVAVATAWVEKRLIFEETPLAEVAEEFNRYNTRRLVISDPELRSLGISGVYASTDPDSLLGFLRAQPNIQLTETATRIRISLREKK